MSSSNSVRIPSWAVGILVGLLLGAFGLWGTWQTARADVDYLKKENVEMKKDIKSLTDVVAAIPYIQNDIKSVKASQTELQRGMNQLLMRNR